MFIIERSRKTVINEKSKKARLFPTTDEALAYARLSLWDMRWVDVKLAQEEDL